MMMKVVISTQMEMCQTGYYTEDFRTQEVPAGFDFASYGEFRALNIMICDLISQ